MHSIIINLRSTLHTDDSKQTQVTELHKRIKTNKRIQSISLYRHSGLNSEFHDLTAESESSNREEAGEVEKIHQKDSDTIT